MSESQRATVESSQVRRYSGKGISGGASRLEVPLTERDWLWRENVGEFGDDVCVGG